MDVWDVFHSSRLEVERGLTTAQVRAALSRGDLNEDDLIRPAGTTVPWARLSEMPALLIPEPEPAPPVPERVETPRIEHEQEFEVIRDLEQLRSSYFEENEPVPFEPPRPFAADGDDDDVEAKPAFPDAIVDDEDEEHLSDEFSFVRDVESRSQLAIPVVAAEDWDGDEEFDPQDEDEAAAEFTLSRGAADRVEELDLAAMVDVAFQLVLFFLVTATTVLYKSLEVPKPNPESPANAAAQQGKSRGMDDLMNTYIVVEIDPSGTMKIDREPVAAEMSAVIERLRKAREETHRKAMLLSADYATQHRNAVLAYDAANEIGLGIAIARPAPPGGAAAPSPAKAQAK